MQQKLLLSTCAVVALLAVAAVGLECREATGNCNKCLSYAECGYCGSNAACVPGNVNGPTHGHCAEWDFASCPSSPTTTPPPPPTATPPPAADSDWTTFGGSNGRSNYKPFSLPTTPSPKQLWQFPTGNPNSPIIYMGSVCFTPAIRFGSCNLTCVDKMTGAFESSIVVYGDASWCGPPSAVEGLIVVQYNGENEGNFVAAYTRSGTSGNLTLMWTATGRSQWPTLPYGVVSAGGLIYAPTGSQSGHIMAINASNGERVWDASGYSPDAGCDLWGPTIHNDQVLWNKETGENTQAMIGGLDTRTGSAVWSETFTEWGEGYNAFWYGVSASPTVVLASPWGVGVNFTAISVGKNPAERKRLWMIPCTSAGQVQPEYLIMSSDGATAFFLCGDQLMNVDLQTGAAYKPYTCAGCTSPVVVLKTHLLVAARTEVVIFDKESRTQVASMSFSSNVTNIAFSDGVMFVMTGKSVDAVALA